MGNNIMIVDSFPEAVPYSPDLQVKFFESKEFFVGDIQIKNMRRVKVEGSIQKYNEEDDVEHNWVSKVFSSCRSFIEYALLYEQEMQFDYRINLRKLNPDRSKLTKQMIFGLPRVDLVKFNLERFEHLLKENGILFEKYFFSKKDVIERKFSRRMYSLHAKIVTVSEKYISIIENAIDANRIEDSKHMNELLGYVNFFKWIFSTTTTVSDEEYDAAMDDYVKKLWSHVAKVDRIC